MSKLSRKEWEVYTSKELKDAAPLLTRHGYTLEDIQPHIQGERYLMQAVTTTSGRKLILIGRNTSTQKKVVIKLTRDTAGKHELHHERVCRKVLATITFAYDVFLSPNELLFIEESGFLIAIYEYIEQERTFLSRPTKEQFAFALAAFKAQEHTHAATYEQERLARRTFGVMEYRDYRASLTKFLKPDHQQVLFENVLDYIESAQAEILQYSGFLTHTDFVPHNFRIRDDAMYLLDHSSIRFGNKYEGWARFLNFMSIYNPELEAVLVEYVETNRTPEERRALHAMRIYRLSELVSYYTHSLTFSDGSLFDLNTARVNLWSTGLSHLLIDDTRKSLFSETEINRYTKKRDALRSTEEKERQKNLH